MKDRINSEEVKIQDFPLTILLIKDDKSTDYTAVFKEEEFPFVAQGKDKEEACSYLLESFIAVLNNNFNKIKPELNEK